MNWRRSKHYLALIPAAVLVGVACLMVQSWRQARGYEYEWVARSLASGYGYSLEAGPDGPGTNTNLSDYPPTAWVEPLPTGIMAASFHIFGEYGRLVLVLLNVLWLGGACLVVFAIVRRLVDSRTGIVMATLYALLPVVKPELRVYIGNAALAGLAVSLCALLLIRSFERTSFGRSAALGATIGLANLTHAGTLLFAPVSALAILVACGIRTSKSWMSAAVVVITAIAVVSPWTLRNAVTFGHLVPVRDGFGLQLYVGNVALAHTFVPGFRIEGTEIEPPWTAAGPRQAVTTVRSLQFDRALRQHAHRVVASRAPEGYQDFNEVERDRHFASRAVAFIGEAPRLAATMMFWKAYAFFGKGGPVIVLITLTSFSGWLLVMRDIRATSLMLLLLSYAFPYVLTLPVWYRYRFPAEPLMIVLTAFLAVPFARQFQRWMV